MNIKDYLKNNVVILDGGMGTLLQSEGLKPGELPELWNISHPDIITKIHKSYYDSGSNIINTNTFGANLIKFSPDELDKIIKASVENARKAKRESLSKNEKFIALDLGPTGKLLKPYGDLDFEDAVKIFSKTVKAGVKYGADLIFIETMNDIYETKAALLAAKESCSLPVFVSNAFGEDGKLMTGADPLALIALLEGMGADAIGVNCSLGPDALAPVIDKYLEYASVPVILKPNAGLPKSVNGKTVYDVSPSEFSDSVVSMIKKGVRVAGGCCGTTPEYIRLLSEKAENISIKPETEKNITFVSSYTHAVIFGDSPVLIGERINPTGKKRFKEALKNNDIDYILQEGINQQEKKVHILDVNVGLPEIDEAKMLNTAIFELQSVVDLPLQIDTSDPYVMECALRIYNGKAMINSVNGKEESMRSIFPLVKKYGGALVALTLDENGIPETAEGRLKIAEKILNTAMEYGIKKKDIIFDPLCLTVSADPASAKETLKSVRLIKARLGCHTSLGISNVSFGLPKRDAINATFFAMALSNGLSAAIMNPYSAEMMKTYYAYRALCKMDDNFSDYISFSETITDSKSVQNNSVAQKAPSGNDFGSELQHAIIHGLSDKAAESVSNLLATCPPLFIVQNEIIPALDEVGKGFEAKTVYLPQLLMSAEAAKSAFEKIKLAVPGDAKSSDKCKFVIATVKGDIHDIGKNIVKLLLENYGFKVTDLGKDVPPQTVVEAVVEGKAPLVGLSALMTTTVPAMEETIRQLRDKAPWCKIVVGGAVLTKEYADAIGADKYAKDAMETVRYAEKINGSLDDK